MAWYVKYMTDRINRIRLEFKDATKASETAAAAKVLIESDWNLKYLYCANRIHSSLY